LIFEEHVGVRKLVLSGYLCECKVSNSNFRGLGWLLDFSVALATWPS
jgi:hypothetical protein